MLKTIAKEFFDRVVKSYKSTLIGIGIGAAVILLEAVANGFQSSPSPVAKGVAAVCVMIGAALKSKALAAGG